MNRQIVSPLDPDTAQQVLDDWGQAIKTNSIQKSKWAWLEGVTRKARAGTFTPTTDAAERRQADKRLKTALQAPPPLPLCPGHPCPRRKPSQIASSGLAEATSGGVPTSWRGRNEQGEME